VALNRWQAKAQKTPQVNTVTPANVGVGNSFVLTINGKSETFVATAATVANVTAGLPPLWNGSDEGEMDEATAVDNTTNILITADTPGTPFTQTSSATGGTAALTTSTTTANISPNDINNATNWTDGIPTANDDLILDEGDTEQGLWWNLGALTGLTMTSMTRRRGFAGRVGLDEYNATGTNVYFEYRATELAVGATTVLIEQPGTDGVGHIKWNGEAVQTALTILGDGPSGLEEERMWFRGTHVSNVVNVVNGSLAIAPMQGQAATVATLRLDNATVRCGSGVTLTTIVSDEGSILEVNSSVTTLTQNGDGGIAYFKKAAALTTGTINRGTLVWQSTGTITTLTPGVGAILDFSQGTGPVTITNQVTFQKGNVFRDPEGRVTFTAGWKLGAGVKLEDVTLDLGTGRSFTVS